MTKGQGTLKTLSAELKATSGWRTRVKNNESLAAMLLANPRGANQQQPQVALDGAALNAKLDLVLAAIASSRTLMQTELHSQAANISQLAARVANIEVAIGDRASRAEPPNRPGS